MKKVFALSIGLLLLASCEQDTIVSETEGVNIDQSSLTRGAKVDVCHNGRIINVSVNALSGHQGHGDAVDMDGDGFFDIVNDCSDTDCDDTNSEVNPGMAEVCDNDIDDNCNGEIDENCLLPAVVGDFREGGIVFWVDPTDNTKGLVCALADAPATLTWANAISYCDGYTNLDTGTGVHSDWSLPTKDELQLMYANLKRFDCTTNTPGGYDLDPCPTNIGNFSNNTYWSSTEFNEFDVWWQFFGNGAQDYNGKSTSFNVRAVRAF